MRKWLRRIAGAIGMELRGQQRELCGLRAALVVGLANTDAPFPIIFGVLGFIAGVIFSGLLMLTEGRRGFDEMRVSRFAAWGAVGGFLLSGLFTRAASLGWADAFVIAPTFAVACAISASGTLALARRAKMRELPDNRGDTGAAITDYEKRKLH
jgi:hypothetical protein